MYSLYQGGSRGRATVAIAPPPKSKKVTLFTILLYNLETNIRDMRPFYRPLFCHWSFVKYAFSLSQSRSRYET